MTSHTIIAFLIGNITGPFAWTFIKKKIKAFADKPVIDKGP